MSPLWGLHIHIIVRPSPPQLSSQKLEVGMGHPSIAIVNGLSETCPVRWITLCVRVTIAQPAKVTSCAVSDCSCGHTHTHTCSATGLRNWRKGSVQGCPSPSWSEEHCSQMWSSGTSSSVSRAKQTACCHTLQRPHSIIRPSSCECGRGEGVGEGGVCVTTMQ